LIFAMLVGMVMVAAVVASIFAERMEGASRPKTRREWARTIAYWVLTIVVSFEMVAGGIWDLLRIEFVRVSLNRLGYPLYLLYILGPPKILCAMALLVPRFPRLKEWAYAGAVINYLGAGASLLLSGRPVVEWVAPLVFAGVSVGSWGLRPAGRKLMVSGTGAELRGAAWWVSLLIAGAMVGAALATLPEGVTRR